MAQTFGGRETIALLTDRDIYFTGDIIWLNAFYFFEEDATGEDLSKVLLLELLDGEEVFVQSKIEINDGRAFGSLRIPEGIPGKNYQLRAYTNWQRNIPPEYYSTLELTVINPASPLPNPLYTWQTNGNDTCDTREETVQIQGLKDTYGVREKVTFSIGGPEQAVDATVAVVKKGAVGGRYPIHTPAPSGGTFHRESMPDWLPDIRDVSLSGMLTDSASGRPVRGELVYVSIVDKDQQQLHIYRTGENGAFIFPLNHLSGRQKVFISSVTNDTAGYKILVNSDFSGQYARFPRVAMAPYPAQRQLLEEMYINYQLQEKYSVVKTDSSHFPGQIPSIFGKPALSVTLSNFIDLPTMEDVFSEIIPYVSVKKKQKHFQLWVLNEEKTGFDQEPLVLIDNLPVFDLDALMQINPDKVSQIDVINSPYLLGSFSIPSVILIKTNTTDFAGMKFPESTVFLDYQTRDLPLEFPVVEYGTPGSSASRLPDFRTVLYWSPGLTIGPSAKEIEFYTSDHASEYSVLVRGFDREGRYFSREESFWVMGK